MAIIYSYPLKTTPLGKDLLVLTDSAVKSRNATRSLTIDDLASYIVGNYPGSPINGSGTFNTIPLWTPDGKTLGDSNINQDANGDIAVGVNLIVVDDLSVQGEIDVDNIITVNGSGDSVFNSTVTFNNNISIYGDAVFEGEANFQSSVTDQTSSPGTAGQVLSSTGTNVEWVDAAEGTVLGSGTSPFLPYWLDSKTLGDSPIAWFPTNTPMPKLSIDTNVSITGITTFLDDITVSEALLAPDNTTPGSHTPGTPGQVLTSTGTNVEWVDRSTYTTVIGNGDASDFNNQLLSQTDSPLAIKFGPGISTTDVTITSSGVIRFNTVGTYFLNLTASLGKPNNQGIAVLNSRFYNKTDVEQFGPTQEFAAKFADETPIERSIIIPVDTAPFELEYQLGVNSNSNYNNGAGLLSANGEPSGWSQTASASLLILKLTT